MIRATLRGVAVVGAVGTSLGLAHLAVRAELPWVGEPSAPGSEVCGADDAGGPAGIAEVVPTLAAIDLVRAIERGGVTVVDARAAGAFAAGHIPGAIHLPATDAETILQHQSLPIPPDHLVVTYCDDGDESASVRHILGTLAGCREVRVLEGGFAAWLAAGAPIEGELQSPTAATQPEGPRSG